MNKEKQVLKNLDLAERFLHGNVDTPELLDRIPDGTTVILVPEDGDLADANVQTARALLQHSASGARGGQPSPAEPDEPTTGGVYLQPVRS